jgi:hypothetical protein
MVDASAINLPLENVKNMRDMSTASDLIAPARIIRTGCVSKATTGDVREPRARKPRKHWNLLCLSHLQHNLLTLSPPPRVSLSPSLPPSPLQIATMEQKFNFKSFVDLRSPAEVSAMLYTYAITAVCRIS